MDHTYPYIASLTREPFLFYEMRSTAKLMVSGLSDDAIVKEIVGENLFQYPTEKSIHGMSKACVKRLHALENASLVSALSLCVDEAKSSGLGVYALLFVKVILWTIKEGIAVWLNRLLSKEKRICFLCEKISMWQIRPISQKSQEVL